MTKPFDYKRPFEIRDGRRAKLIAHVPEAGDEKLAVLIFERSGAEGRIYSYYENGSYFDGSGERADETDLVNIVAKTVDFRNFNEHGVSAAKHDCFADALANAGDAARGVMRFEWHDCEFAGVSIEHVFIPN